MQNSKDVIVLKVYALLKELIPILNKMPRAQKFALGDRLQNHVSDLLEGYIRAYYAQTPQKIELLQANNLALEIIRHYIRLAFELNYFSQAQYKTLAEQVNEIGRMTGGWLKSLKP